METECKACSEQALLASECSWPDLSNGQLYMIRGTLVIFNTSSYILFMYVFAGLTHRACSSHVALFVMEIAMGLSVCKLWRKYY